MSKKAILLFLVSVILPVSFTVAQTRCFKLFVPGTQQEISVICAGVPFEIRNCSVGIGSADYYCLDSTQARNQVTSCYKENKPGVTFKIDTPGKHVITQLFIINSTVRYTLEKRYVVKSTPPPTFTATTCGRGFAEITVTDTNYDAYQLAVNNDQPVPINRNTPTIIPTPTGSYTIYVTARYNMSSWCGSNSVGLTSPEAPANPAIQNLNVLGTATSGKILFTLTNLKSGYNYHIEEQNGTVYQQKGNLVFRAAADTITVRGLSTSTPRNYRVTVYDMCGSLLSFSSPPVSSTNLTAISLNNKVELTWPPYPNSTGRQIYYEVKRTSGMAGNEIIFPDKITGTSFTDSTASCGVTYCYELLVVENNKAFSQSNDPCVLVTSTIAPGGGFLLTSFTPDNTLTGTLTLPKRATLSQLNIFKNGGSSTYKFLANSSASQFTDQPSLTATTCYKTTYTDNCGNTSLESNSSCPVILQSEYDAQARALKLTWTNYVGFTGNPEYTLETLDRNGIVISQKSVSGILSITETQFSNSAQLLQYRIKAETAKPGERSYSNTILLEQQAGLHVPSAFSPNGDGLNDVFEVKGRFQNNFSLVILNRWGQVLFDTNDPKKGWNGLYNGKTAPVGVYVFKVKATDEAGRKFEKTGTVTLVK